MVGLVQVRVPDELHRRFKALASLQGTTMQALVVGWIREWVKANEAGLMRQPARSKPRRKGDGEEHDEAEGR